MNENPIVGMKECFRGEYGLNPFIRYCFTADGKTVGDGYVYLGTEHLSRFGNLGYSVAAEYQGQGYGTCICGLLLDELRKQGVARPVAVVEETNLYSRKVCEANRGHQIRQLRRDGKNYVIYQFDK